MGRHRRFLSGAALISMMALVPATSLGQSTEPTAHSQPVASPAAGETGAPELKIADAEEPGSPLRIVGKVVDAGSGLPIAGAEVVVYQADDGGGYEPSDPGDESTARLRGEMSTDADGRFAFRTVLPGEYPDRPSGNRHIHVHSVGADGYAPRGSVILFDDNVRDDVRAWARDTGFGQVIETNMEDGVLVGQVDVLLEPLGEEPTATP